RWPMPEEIYSPGLEGIIAGETAISTIAGGLQYRGYKIEELAEHATFEEVAYLILRGELPKRKELEDFQRRVAEASKVPPEIINLLGKIPREASMMDVMRSGASLLAHWDPDEADGSRAANLRKSERLLARLPMIMAARHRLRRGEKPVEPDPKLS